MSKFKIYLLTFIKNLSILKLMMKTTIYTITNCPFSQAEKDYLNTNKFQFEEKNLEEHREFLAEMLDLSEKWAGVPFTVLTKDDGTLVKLKGFTKDDFDKAYGLVQANQPTSQPVNPPTSQPFDSAQGKPASNLPSEALVNGISSNSPQPAVVPPQPPAPTTSEPTAPVSPIPAEQPPVQSTPPTPPAGGPSVQTPPDHPVIPDLPQ